jgi:hypothetical protein
MTENSNKNIYDAIIESVCMISLTAGVVLSLNLNEYTFAGWFTFFLFLAIMR